jgi:DNA polymerase V
MDIYAKHQPADKDGLRMAELDEISYREKLWTHTPITDFWRIGRGYAKRLASVGIHTMGDVARCSVGGPGEFYNEDLLYRLFGVNAELLIDHAWGYEPCTIADVKAYRPVTNSLSSGQVLARPYEYDSARIVLREMVDLMVLDLVRKGLVTDQIVLTVCYDIDNLKDPVRAQRYHGPVAVDYYGRRVPKHAHGTTNLPSLTSSSRTIVDAAMALFDRIADRQLLIRRFYIYANHVQVEPEGALEQASCGEQLDFFTNYEAKEQQAREEAQAREQERHVQRAILDIQEKFGKNAILKGTSLEEGATTIERNNTIGGHKA